MLIRVIDDTPVAPKFDALSVQRLGDGQITDVQRDRDRALALPRQAQGQWMADAASPSSNGRNT